MSTCQHCGVEVQSRQRGRPIKFCSDRCRKAASRKGNLRTKKAILKDSTGLQKHLKISKQKQQVACPEIEFSEKTPLRFEQVNEVTWKLTDGTDTDVPASHGQWGGYRTTKAVAWIMEVGPKQWVARCGDMASEALPLAQAKTAASADACLRSARLSRDRLRSAGPQQPYRPMQRARCDQERVGGIGSHIQQTPVGTSQRVTRYLTALNRRCQSKILNTWSCHRTAQIDPEKRRKINSREIRL